jgi:hypothetical protein
MAKHDATSEDDGKELAPSSLVVSRTRVGANPVEYIADVLDPIDKPPIGFSGVGPARTNRGDDERAPRNGLRLEP